MAAPAVHTYHCICTSLLLASTHTLSSLPRRASPSLDKAIILPLPPPPASRLPSTSPDSENDEPEAKPMPEVGFTSLLSMVPDRKVTLVRREDGFERRYLWRCGRCRLMVGYGLDDGHIEGTAGGEAQAMELDGDREGVGKIKVIYLLPGGFMSTDMMAAGKKISETDVAIGNGEDVIAAWE